MPQMDIYFWRQTFAVSVALAGAITFGSLAAFPAILNPAILNHNTTYIKATEHEASWIASMPGFSGLLSAIVVPIIMQQYGRSFIYRFNYFCSFCGWTIIAFATSVAELLVGRAFHGVMVGFIVTSSIVTSEYVHPTRRGYFMVVKKFAVVLGVLFCHLMLMLSIEWKTVAQICIAINAFGFVMAIFLKESPAFLALKGRYDECKQSHKWLHGDIDQEVLDLIIDQEENRRNKHLGTTSVRDTLKMLLKKDFWTPFCITIVLSILIESIGKSYFAAYIVPMMVKVTGDQSIALYMTLGNDLVTLASMFVSGVIITYFSRRTLIFTFGFISVLLMFLISAITFSNAKYIWFETDYISAIFVFCLSILGNVSVVPVTYTLLGEIFPLHLKGIGVSAAGLVKCLIFAAALKLTPMLLLSVGVSGLFLIYGILALVSLLVLYFILPETKDRPLLHVDYEISGRKPITQDVSLLTQQ